MAFYIYLQKKIMTITQQEILKRLQEKSKFVGVIIAHLKKRLENIIVFLFRKPKCIYIGILKPYRF